MFRPCSQAQYIVKREIFVSSEYCEIHKNVRAPQ